LPASQHLCTDYQQKVFSNHKEQLKALLSAAPSVAIVTDEASNAQGRFGLHIWFIPELGQKLTPRLNLVCLFSRHHLP